MPLTVELMNKIKVTSHLTWKSDPEKLWLESPPNGIHGFFFLMKYATEHFGWIRSEKNYKFISSFFKLGDSFHIRIKFGCFDAAAVSPLHYIHWVGPNQKLRYFFSFFHYLLFFILFYAIHEKHLWKLFINLAVCSNIKLPLAKFSVFIFFRVMMNCWS